MQQKSTEYKFFLSNIIKIHDQKEKLGPGGYDTI